MTNQYQSYTQRKEVTDRLDRNGDAVREGIEHIGLAVKKDPDYHSSQA